MAKRIENGVSVEEREPTPEEIAEREAWAAGEYDRQLERVKEFRRLAHTKDSDPIFFKYQRGEATEQDWKDAVQAVIDAYPYPDPDNLYPAP